MYVSLLPVVVARVVVAVPGRVGEQWFYALQNKPQFLIEVDSTGNLGYDSCLVRHDSKRWPGLGKLSEPRAGTPRLLDLKVSHTPRPGPDCLAPLHS